MSQPLRARGKPGDRRVELKLRLLCEFKEIEISGNTFGAGRCRASFEKEIAALANEARTPTATRGGRRAMRKSSRTQERPEDTTRPAPTAPTARPTPPARANPVAPPIATPRRTWPARH